MISFLIYSMMTKIGFCGYVAKPCVKGTTNNFGVIPLIVTPIIGVTEVPL
jgi:hypothetical protein